MPLLLRQPLVVFLLCGAGLFYLYDIVGSAGNQGAGDIVVSRDALLTFLQYRAKRFDANWAQAHLDSLSAAALEEVVEQYVREEALYREAQALQLARDDYIIKQRLIQKVEYIARSVSENLVAVDEDELTAFFEENRENYRRQAVMTFTHIFFDSRNQGADEAKRRAQQKLAQLQGEPVPFEHAGRYGDRFLYHINYVARSRDFVASHFGEAMAEALFQLPEDAARWQGPFQSDYGYHLVLVSEFQPARVPVFEDVAARVREDLIREKKRQMTSSAIDAIVAAYRVERDMPLQQAARRPLAIVGEASQ